VRSRSRTTVCSFVLLVGIGVLSWVLECSVGVVVDSWVLEGSQKVLRLEKKKKKKKKKAKVITLRGGLKLEDFWLKMHVRCTWVEFYPT
jgi:hypothetical protein